MIFHINLLNIMFALVNCMYPDYVARDVDLM